MKISVDHTAHVEKCPATKERTMWYDLTFRLPSLRRKLEAITETDTLRNYYNVDNLIQRPPTNGIQAKL